MNNASVHDYYDRPPLKMMCPDCWGDVVERREASPFGVTVHEGRTVISVVCSRHQRLIWEAPAAGAKSGWREAVEHVVECQNEIARAWLDEVNQ